MYDSSVNLHIVVTEVRVNAHPNSLVILHVRTYSISSEIIIAKGCVNIIWKLALVEVYLA